MNYQVQRTWTEFEDECLSMNSENKQASALNVSGCGSSSTEHHSHSSSPNIHSHFTLTLWLQVSLIKQNRDRINSYYRQCSEWVHWFLIWLKINGMETTSLHLQPWARHRPKRQLNEIIIKTPIAIIAFFKRQVE